MPIFIYDLLLHIQVIQESLIEQYHCKYTMVSLNVSAQWTVLIYEHSQFYGIMNTAERVMYAVQIKYVVWLAFSLSI